MTNKESYKKGYEEGKLETKVKMREIIIERMKKIDETIVGYTRPIDERNRMRQALQDLLDKPEK